MTDQIFQIKSDRDSATLDIVNEVAEFKKEAESAKLHRKVLDRRNMDVYQNRQNYSDKQAGQSQEFLPKTDMAVEQTVAFIRKALTLGEWFSIGYEGKRQEITGQDIQKFLKHYIEDIMHIPELLYDAIKVALLKSLVVIKVYGNTNVTKSYNVDEIGNLFSVEEGKDVVVAELVDTKNYYPDPTNKWLYEIHSTSRDLYEVIDLAEQGYYELDAIESIKQDFKREEDEYRKALEAGQDVANPPVFRKKIQIDEFWGSLLTPDGKISKGHRNIVVAIANEKYIIRKPAQNPRWDSESPFIVSPLTTVPFSVWHKAFFDHVVSLNLALNELFNLMLDGAIGSVWGIKVINDDALKDPSAISNGIAQGDTLAIRAGIPPDQVLKQISTGSIPPEALAMYNILEREYQAGSLHDDIQMGMLPKKQVKATEVIASGRNSSMFFESMLSTIETRILEPLIAKIWNSFIQISKNVVVEDLTPYMTEQAAQTFVSMQVEERFAEFAANTKIKVFGLSATLTKAQEFQKLMALLQIVATNPVLGQEFLQKYSPGKVLDQLIKSLGIDMAAIEITKEEKMQRLMEQMLGGGTPPMQANQNNEQKQAGKTTAQLTGSPSVPAEIAKNVQGNMGFSS